LNMWNQLFGIQRTRERLLEQSSPGALRDYYAEPFPELKTNIKQAPFVALDFETTGLDIKNDHIVSVGSVEIINLGIKLNTAKHEIIKTALDMPQDSTVIHQITDDMVLHGTDIKDAFDKLLASLTGRVLIAHHAKIELGFLNKICLDLYQQNFVIPTVDTRQLAERQLKREQVVLKENSLRLFELRNRYKLPAYKAHNALSDAMSTAELFLVLVAELYPNLNCRIKDLVLKK